MTRVRTTAIKDMAPLGGSTTTLAATQTTWGYTWWDDTRQAGVRKWGKWGHAPFLRLTLTVPHVEILGLRPFGPDHLGDRKLGHAPLS